MTGIACLKGRRGTEWELSGCLPLPLAMPEPCGGWGLPGLGVSCQVQVLSRCLVPREGTVSPSTAPGAAVGPALPLSAFPTTSVPSLSPSPRRHLHCLAAAV